MPIGVIAKPPMPIYGQITVVSEEAGQYGTQYVAHITQINPKALTERLVYFPPKETVGSKWMNFVQSAQRFFEIKKLEDLYGKFVEITDMPGRMYKDRETGEDKQAVQPMVTAHFATEAECLEAWRKAAVENGIDPEAEPIAPTAGQAQAAQAAKPLVDAGTLQLMKSMYASMGKNDAAFLGAIVPMGYAGDAGPALLAMVKA
jgi:hypothetical protein